MPTLRVPRLLNFFVNSISKKPDQTGNSISVQAGSLIISGPAQQADEVLQYFLKDNSPVIEQPRQISIVIRECEEQAFFTGLYFAANLQPSGPYDPKATPTHLLGEFIKASANRSFVLTIPTNLVVLSPIILKFISALLEVKDNAKSSINIGVVMKVEPQESYPFLVERILQKHSDVFSDTYVEDRKIVATRNLKDFAITGEISKEQRIILVIVSLFAGKEIDYQYLSSIFQTKRIFKVDDNFIEMGEYEFQEHFLPLTTTLGLLSQHIEEENNYVSLRASHQLPYLLEKRHTISFEGQSLADMVLTHHVPQTATLLTPLLLLRATAVRDQVIPERDDEYDALVTALPQYKAKFDVKANAIIERLLEILLTSSRANKENLIQKFKAQRVPSQTYAENLVPQEKLVLSILALLGHRRIAKSTLNILFKAKALQNKSLQINNEQFCKVLGDLCRDNLFITENEGVVYFPSPEFRYYFEEQGRATEGLVAALLQEQTINSDSTLQEGLLLLKSEITDIEHAALPHEKFKAVVASGEYEKAYPMAKLLLAFELKQSSPNPRAIFDLWEARIKYRPKSFQEDQDVQTQVVAFINSATFKILPHYEQFNLLNLFITARSLTSIRLFGGELGKLLFDKSQELFSVEVRLSKHMSKPYYADDLKPQQGKELLTTQRKSLADKSNEKYASNLTQEIISRDEKFAVLAQKASNTYVGYICEIIKAQDFQKFFKDAGIDNLDAYKKFFVLRLVKKLNCNTDKIIPENEKQTFKQKVLNEREGLLDIIREDEFHRNFSALCYLSGDLPQCFHSIQKRLKYSLANDIYTPNTLYFAAMMLLLERIGFSRTSKEIEPLFELFKRKLNFENPDSLFSSNSAQADYQNISSDEAVKNDPMIKFIFMLVATRKEKITQEHLAMLSAAEEQALKQDDIHSYIACVFTRIKLIDLVEPNLNERHNVRTAAITRVINYFLENCPTQILLALYLLAVVWPDQVWLMGSDAHPLIPQSVLDGLLSQYEKNLQTPELYGSKAVINRIGNFLTDSERQLYINSQGKLPNYIKVKMLLALSGNMLGLSDFYYQQMLACIAENTPQSIERGIKVAKVFIEQQLFDGLQGRLSAAGALMAVAVLYEKNQRITKGNARKTVQGTPREDDSLSIIKNFLQPGVGSIFYGMLKNYFAGAAVASAGEASVEKLMKVLTDDSPGAVYPHLAELALIARERNSSVKLANKFHEILKNLNSKELATSPELISILGEFIDLLPEANRQTAANAVLGLSIQYSVPETRSNIVKNFPEADTYIQEVNTLAKDIHKGIFNFSDDIPPDANIRRIALNYDKLTERPYKTDDDFTLTQAIISLLEEMLANIDISFTSINVPIVLVFHSEGKWYKLSRDITRRTTIRFSEIDKNILSKTVPVEFLKRIPPLTVSEVISPCVNAKGDPYFDKFSKKSNCITAASLGEGLYCFFEGQSIYSAKQVQARELAKFDAEIKAKISARKLAQARLDEADSFVQNSEKLSVELGAKRNQIAEMIDRRGKLDTQDSECVNLSYQIDIIRKQAEQIEKKMADLKPKLDQYYQLNADLANILVEKKKLETKQSKHILGTTEYEQFAAQIAKCAEQIQEKQAAMKVLDPQAEIRSKLRAELDAKKQEENLIKNKQAAFVAPRQDRKTTRLGVDASVPDMRKIISPLYPALLLKLLAQYQNTYVLWENNSNSGHRENAPHPNSSTNDVVENNDKMGCLAIPDLLDQLSKLKFTQPGAFEETLKELEELEDAFPYLIVEQRKAIAVKLIQGFFTSTTITKILVVNNEISKQTAKNAAFENLELFFEYAVITSCYDFEINPTMINNIITLVEIVNLPQETANKPVSFKLELFIAQASFHLAMEKCAADAITYDFILSTVAALPKKVAQGNDFYFYLAANYVRASSDPARATKIFSLIKKELIAPEKVTIAKEIQILLMNKDIEVADERASILDALASAAKQVGNNLGNLSSNNAPRQVISNPSNPDIDGGPSHTRSTAAPAAAAVVESVIPS